MELLKRIDLVLNERRLMCNTCGKNWPQDKLKKVKGEMMCPSCRSRHHIPDDDD